jgi:hypothetical protein
LIQDVAVIGLGIVGQVALAELAGEDLNIAVIDEFNKDPQLRFLRDIDGSPSVWTAGSRIEGFPGGRLNWGKNCSFVTVKNHRPLGDNLQIQLPGLARRLRKYGFPKLTLIELDKNSDRKFYVKEAEDFPAESWLTNAESQGNVLFISGSVTEITQEPTGELRITIRKSDKSAYEVLAKKVIICAGAFGSQELLANSRFLSKRPPRIRDHISFASGSIPLSKVRLTKFGLFGWNRHRRLNIKRCNTFYDKSTNILWTLRIFPEGVLDLQSALSLLKKEIRESHYINCFRMIANLAESLVTGKLLYQEIKIHLSADFLNDEDYIKSASYGDGGKIDFLEYDFESIPISRELKEFVWQTVKKLDLGLKDKLEIKLPDELDLREITSSSHHMGTIFRSVEELEVSPLEVSKNIFVAGSSVFQSSVPGHPTMLAAAIALAAADRVKSELT